jgi:hypothetical protein
MQIISPNKFKESDINKIELKSLFAGEDSNFVNLFQIAFECNEEKKNAPLLSSIDPYDNTIFNSRQCAVILLEIEEIIKVKKVDGIERVIEIFKSIDNFEYLVLRGD